MNKQAMKQLTLPALFALMFSSMMGSGVFDIPQNIAHKAGVAAILVSWGITAVGMFALGFAFVYLINKRPDVESGIYGYAKHGFGDFAGFNAAWGYWVNAVLGNASYLIYLFATLGQFAIFRFFGSGDTWYALLCQSIINWFVYFLITKGIKEAAVINTVISIVKIAALVILIILFIYGFKISVFVADFHIQRDISFIDQVRSTMLVTVWDFLGIEAACIYASRAKNIKDVAKATIWGLALVLLIDIAMSVLPLGIVEQPTLASMSTPSTAGVIAYMFHNNAIYGYLLKSAIIISVFGALLAWMMLATNIIFHSAEDKTMPKIFAKLNHKLVPQNALLASSIALQVFITVAYFTNSVYLQVIQLATSMILVPYGFSALFAFKLMIKDGIINKLEFLKGLIAVIYCIWLVYAGGINYLFLSTILYALGFILYYIARREQSLKIFTHTYEFVLCIMLFVVAILCGILWYLGIVTM